MSLSDSLEGLGLGDALQIIGLSQKAGVLSIRSEEGEGTIVIRGGRVCAAHLNGTPTDLQSLLVAAGLLDRQQCDDACELARREGTSLEEALAARASITAARVDSLRRECVEAAVMAMFAWRAGSFSFEIHGQLENDDPRLFLPDGIDAQNLALEGLRGEDAPGQLPSNWRCETRADSIDHLSEEQPQSAVRERCAVEAPLSAAQEGACSAPRDRLAPHEALPLGAPNAALVVIDPDLVALEWIKRTLEDAFCRIHVFQRWDLGLNPIRQYLARAGQPVVMLQPEARGDPLGGIRDGHDFVARLKAQQPRLPVLWLQESGGPVLHDLGQADGTVTRPSSRQLRSLRASRQLQQLGETLRDDLATILFRDASAAEPAPEGLRDDAPRS